MKKLLPLLLVFFVTTFAFAQCDYTLELTDNFGNDWDSGDNLAANTGVDVTVAGVTTTYLVLDPSPVANMPVVENYTITVNDADALSIDYRATFFPGDGSFRLLDSEGIEVYASPINQPSMMDIFTGTATCPTCFAVTMLTTNNITADGAEIGWTATGTETAWEVEYGPVGFTPGSGTTVNATANPWPISGLMSETDYDVYVRADCGMGDISSNQGPVTFTTTPSCPMPSAFAPLPTTATSIPFTWDANGNTSTNFEIEYGPSPYTLGNGGTTITGVTAPFADVTGLIPNTTYDFYVRIDCGMGDFSSWSAAYTASTLQSCPNITGVTFSNISQTSIDVDWVAGGTETEWEIEYGVAPLTPGTGTTVTTLTIPTTITGLLSGTSYEVCITAVCGPMDRSTPVCDTVLTPADYCNGDQLVDSGGTTGTYSPDEDITYTVCPDNAGDVVYVDFIEFVLEDSGTGCFDGLTVYNGPDTNAPTINPPGGGTEWCWDTTSGTGDLVGELLIGSLPSGCLTFVFQSDGSVQRDGFIANVTCGLPPTCPAPADLMFDSSTNTTVDLSWTNGGTETQWNIEYGAPGFTPGMGTTVSAMTNPFSVTGLTQNTTYDFYITAICGPGDESSVVGPISGTTQCDAVIAPYSEDFEMNFTPTTNNFPVVGDAFVLENCYSAINSNYFWVVAPASQTASGNTGPDPSVATGVYFYAEGSSGTNGAVAELSTPLFDSSALTIPAVGFDYHMTGDDMGSLEVIVRAGGTDTVVATLTGQQQANDTDPFLNLNVALNAFSGQTFQVIFKATRGNDFESDIAIDNITINEAPDCPAPLGLTVDSTTSDSITLSWTNGGSETAWEIEYVTPGAAQGTGTVVPATTNPFTIPGLTENTPFDFYLRAVCAIGDESLWTGPTSGRTNCVAFTVPFTEGFNSTSSTQDCWTVIDENGDGDQWDLNYGFNTSEGDEVAAINTDFNGGNNDDYLISPAITLTGVDRLRYDYRVQSAGEPDDMEVLISTTGNSVADFTTVLLPVATYSNTTYMEEIIDLSAYTGDVYVAWRIPTTTTDGWRMYIDNVRFEVTPACDEPVMLTATAATTTTIDIGFTERGTATSWEIEYGAPGFVLGSGTLVAASSNPFTLTGLTPGLCYDYYVRSACPTSGFSPWSAAGNFCTQCLAFDVPFQEGFNANSTTQQCWTVLDENGDGDQWDLDYAFNAFEGDQSAAINTDFNGGVDDDYLISPQINLTAAGQRLIYQYRVQSSFEPNNMEVLLSTTGLAPADFTNVLLPVAQYANTSYMEQTIDLSAFSGPVYIAWRIPPTALDGWRVYIDDVVVEDIPTCPDPLMVAASAVQANSADISWAAEPLATGVTIEYGPCGFVPGTMDPNAVTVTATSNPFNISGLVSGTCYEAYVSFDCSGDPSVLSAAAVFNTQCDPIPSPYQEGFNSASTTENCWSVIDANGDGDAWDLNYAQNPFEGDQVAVINTDFNGGSDDDYLVSPTITLTGNQQLRYQYRVQSSFEPNNMEVLLSTTGAGAADFTVTLLPAAQYSNTTYMEQVIDLSAYTGNVNVAFRIPPSSIDGWRMYIDDVNFEDRPSCPKPDMLAVDMVQPTSANFSWNETGSATVWQVEVQPTGVAQGTAGAIFENLTATNPQVLSGLSSETTYDVYVRSDCGMGDFSDWEGPLTFSTPCDVFSLPYGTATTPGNDFSTFPGNCWSEGNDTDIVTGPNGNNGAWTSDDWANTTPHVNTMSAKINLYDDASVHNDWLVSPSFDLGATSHGYRATFNVALTEFAGPNASNFGSDDEIQMLITSDGGSTWNNLITWNAASAVSHTGQQEVVDLAAYSGVVQMAFWSSRGTVADTEDVDFFIDNFTIDSTASNDDAFAKAELVIYPNPVAQTLFVRADVVINKLTVFNLLGQSVMENVITDAPQINVQDLPSGVYILNIQSGENKKSVRFIKE
ncbi:putative secreted protein (Por secretion system target) [Nonlabens dokdonensis]|uniref:Secreted protein (Por secretion system target) n=2 Tax=Nonlabens dokdonensis TaxID=328515 RepID=A0ABX5PWB9_9FLAO|nr:choice-of-anchor J domain-containing protein [Nonlabens dokdonensis]AGC78719.1 putative hemagluttinin family protein [Nonlabens dokdonensis DSW-6]PZX39154.1 putative secreted protein (Por secretion system target) [Nonlabens dokdonensis]